MNNQEFLKDYLEYIPGAQTLSKHHRQFVAGVAPAAASHAKGAYFWDIEGKQYLDLSLALGPMVFGYANERVDAAVKRQIDRGTIFSIPGEPELALAKLIRQVVPCGEMSRFLLNGNDVTSGAIRLARHITGRSHVAKCGYHGWQDWSVAPKKGRNNGIPELVKTLTHEFVYNDLASLEEIFQENPDQIAAVILEPTTTEAPAPGFLAGVRDLAHKYGALCIFDELVTGFRWALGGAQEYFGVTPDLACFGKAVSNGYPLGILAGKKEYMERLDEVFVSTTFGGYLPGIVAAIETITMMQENKNHSYLHELGMYLITEANKIAEAAHIPVEFIGYGPHPVMTVTVPDDFHARVIKSYIYQEMNVAGIFFSSSMMIGFIHTREQIESVLKKFSEIAEVLASTPNAEELVKKVQGEVVAPRTVRNKQ